ncbi:MAG TPA: 3-phosphoshikimate 1-carboxyvinyltransferase [Dehalococcoidia bacterium]|nr:3-phosphoshikimate 1-carboxyvinyltransferase [Dehalococcoidia bacterium]
MKAVIGKSDIKGRVFAPPSKSYTIRGLMCAALAKGDSCIINPLVSDDTEAAADVLGQVGVDIDKEDGWWRVRGGCLHQPQTDLFCRDSAATLRFMTAIASLVPGRCRLTMGASLSKRPVEPLLEALAELGVDCWGEDGSVVVNSGRLRGGEVAMRGDISSQFISALLLVSPLAENGVTTYLTAQPESKPYLEMTLGCMRRFGIEVEASTGLMRFDISRQEYTPISYSVEGDWSSASYFLAFGAVSGRVEIANLNVDSLQGDRIMINLLRKMGADVSISGGSVMVRQSRLKAITADLSDCIDLLPTMAVLAAVAEGRSVLKGIGRARLKESNRVTALRDGLEKMGVSVTEEEDRIIIDGTQPEGAEIDSFGDHRIAMAFSIAGAVAGNTIINGAECVAKTYPEFWQAFESLGGEVKLDV